jgi:hypothetical protein
MPKKKSARRPVQQRIPQDPLLKKFNLDHLYDLSPGDKSWARALLTGWPLSDFFPQTPEEERLLLNSILAFIEEDAKQILHKDLPPGISEDLADVNEKKLFKDKAHSAGQIGAFAVLAHSAKLKELLARLGNGDRWRVNTSQPLIDAASKFFTPVSVKTTSGSLAPPVDKLSAEELGRRIALEGMRLACDLIKTDVAKNLGSNIKRGVAFRDGPRNNRADKLKREIERTLRERGPKFRTRELWAHFEARALAGDKIIIEVTDDAITWKNRKDRTRSSSYKTFQNRVSEIRKPLKTVLD